mmetsp:Transcript_28336/g.60060  ORF Transcript_28336/g.60060 Transcript_28336/m.60060 type:complete len:431 (-) Transcript_28336:583-1875(-)
MRKLLNPSTSIFISASSRLRASTTLSGYSHERSPGTETVRAATRVMACGLVGTSTLEFMGLMGTKTEFECIIKSSSEAISANSAASGVIGVAWERVRVRDVPFRRSLCEREEKRRKAMARRARLREELREVGFARSHWGLEERPAVQRLEASGGGDVLMGLSSNWLLRCLLHGVEGCSPPLSSTSCVVAQRTVGAMALKLSISCRAACKVCKRSNLLLARGSSEEVLVPTVRVQAPKRSVDSVSATWNCELEQFMIRAALDVPSSASCRTRVSFELLKGTWQLATPLLRPASLFMTRPSVDKDWLIALASSASLVLLDVAPSARWHDFLRHSLPARSTKQSFEDFPGASPPKRSNLMVSTLCDRELRSFIPVDLTERCCWPRPNTSSASWRLPSSTSRRPRTLTPPPPRSVAICNSAPLSGSRRSRKCSM